MSIKESQDDTDYAKIARTMPSVYIGWWWECAQSRPEDFIHQSDVQLVSNTESKQYVLTGGGPADGSVGNMYKVADHITFINEDARRRHVYCLLDSKDDFGRLIYDYVGAFPE